MTATAPDVLFLLSRAAHALTTEMTAALADLGISPRAHCVLSKAMAGGLTQKQLADVCDLDKTTMVVTIDELERAGWAVRVPSATDRRARIIAVTDEGVAMVDRAQHVVAALHADVLAAVPEADRDAFVAGLQALAQTRLAHAVACDPPVRRTRGT